MTHDRKLILKTVTKKERRFLIESLLPVYAERVCSQKGSLLAKLLGVYTIKTSKGLKENLLMMENVIGTEGISAIFDMKGSKLARKILKHDQEIPVEELPSYQTYKDLDFFQTQKVLHLSQTDKARLKAAIQSDISLLRQQRVMDYSLLLAIGRVPSNATSDYLFFGTGIDTGKAYFIGIIDFLGLYSARKQLEGVSKSFLHKKLSRDDISSVDSEPYAKRFLQLIENIIPT